jgi:5S rRNA maturation endonuclease (ribonuclease M5)
MALAAGLTTLVAADEPRKPGATGIFTPSASHDLSLAVLDEKRLQDELKVTDAQREKFAPLAKNFDEAKKTRQADRKKDKTAARTAYEAAQAEGKKGVEAILTAEQHRRLTQIERQVAGLGAYLDETNAKELKLTDDQRLKVKEAHVKMLRAIATESPIGPTGQRDEKALRKCTDAAAIEINGILTDEQKKAWKDLLGEPFDTTGFRFQPIVSSKQ